MAAAAPRYSVPSRHYFSRCAVPALHQHVSDNIIRALTNAVSDKVHLTTDTWTSAAGLGPSLTLGLVIYCRRRGLRGLPRSRCFRPTMPPPPPTPPPPPPPNYHPWARRHQSVALGTAAVPSLSDSRRKSSTDAATLRAAQRRLQLPAHRLLCDVPTRWNSTLTMLSRVYQQRRAIVDCQMSTSTRTGSQVSQLPQVYNEEWTWMSDICQVLSNFEESTQMVSGDAAIISLTIPLLSLLKNSLVSVKSEALCSSQETGEEDSLVDSQSTLRSVSQRISEEVEEDEEEEEENVGETEEGTIVQSFTVQRVWAEEEELEELEEEEMGSQASEGSEFLRVQRIYSSTDYWVFTLLDPRYKQNLSTLIPREERSVRMHEYQQALVHKLKQYFPSDSASGRGRTSAGQVARESRRAGNLSSTGRGTLYKAFASFMSPQQGTVTCPQSRQSRADLYRKMVREYVADHTIVLNDHTTPYNYWVSKLDMWHELALYALEVLACPEQAACPALASVRFTRLLPALCHPSKTLSPVPSFGRVGLIFTERW
ncbi:hypothetical protein GDO81_008664 [Engystomops pustulosus]|uniref:Uncharacterized protein n=1 Tax=Engystomops pustulosus TaxID=76066 RepID=A0AAV7CG95_ENGPU|nr:hypothetical protein GDO81_008664 [Engystomops pustulosus]